MKTWNTPEVLTLDFAETAFVPGEAPFYIKGVTSYESALDGYSNGFANYVKRLAEQMGGMICESEIPSWAWAKSNNWNTMS